MNRDFHHFDLTPWKDPEKNIILTPHKKPTTPTFKPTHALTPGFPIPIETAPGSNKQITRESCWGDETPIASEAPETPDEIRRTLRGLFFFSWEKKRSKYI